MKKSYIMGLMFAAAFLFTGCVKDFYMYVDEMTCQQGRGGRAESTFKEGKCPEKNAQGKGKTAGFCQDANDADLRVYTYDPITADQLKEICGKMLPGSSYKDK